MWFWPLPEVICLKDLLKPNLRSEAQSTCPPVARNPLLEDDDSIQPVHSCFSSLQITRGAEMKMSLQPLMTSLGHSGDAAAFIGQATQPKDIQATFLLFQNEQAFGEMWYI